MRSDVAERLARLLAAARRIADPASRDAGAIRARLIASSELSAEGVELALARCLESAPSPEELERLAARAIPARRAHVLLSASVFTAAHRAIALALAASSTVLVRPSRRDPAFSELLHACDPALFALAPELSPEPGDHVYAYGGAETLAALRGSLPSGTILHAHGPGFGVIVIGARAACDAELVARDVALFDQRGCLSPRVVLVEGAPSAARELAERLAGALARVEVALPLGRVSRDELAEIVRYRDALAYAGTLFSAGRGFVGVAPPGAPFRVAPVARNLHVIATEDAAAAIAGHSASITTYALAGSSAFAARVSAALPRARPAALGRMQAPAFDGPVDLRNDPNGERL
jgi:hypothetical protein